jgi:hypothetical protein
MSALGNETIRIAFRTVDGTGIRYALLTAIGDAADNARRETRGRQAHTGLSAGGKWSG